MERSLQRLFAYDESSRALKQGKALGIGLTAGTISELMEIVRPIADEILCVSEPCLARELGEILRFRVVHLLLPEQCLFGNPSEDKPIIRTHLQNLGLQPEESLVRAIKYFCENFRAKRLEELKKTTIVDVYVKMPRTYRDIMKRQNSRCATCGVVLAYGENMQLDHVIPWHLADDPPDGSNWQFLCERCNRGKGKFPFYSLHSVGSNWISPTYENRLREDVRYAVLVRDGKCEVTGSLPREAELTVRKKTGTGCWVLDNLQTVRLEDEANCTE